MKQKHLICAFFHKESNDIAPLKFKSAMRLSNLFLYKATFTVFLGLEHHVVYLPCCLFVQWYPSWDVSKFSIVGKIFIIRGFFVVCFAELIVVWITPR
jgi:hypothetical protein